MAEKTGFESIEHTADLAVRAWAGDMRGLIEQAARGMLDLMLKEPPAAVETVEVVGEGESREELIVDCLRGILLLINVRGLVPVSVEVSSSSEERAVCMVGVVPLDEGREALVEEIKAVTYHGIDVRQEDDSLGVEVVFDV